MRAAAYRRGQRTYREAARVRAGSGSVQDLCSAQLSCLSHTQYWQRQQGHYLHTTPHHTSYTAASRHTPHITARAAAPAAVWTRPSHSLTQHADHARAAVRVFARSRADSSRPAVAAADSGHIGVMAALGNTAGSEYCRSSAAATARCSTVVALLPSLHRRCYDLLLHVSLHPQPSVAAVCQLRAAAVSASSRRLALPY